MTASMRQSPGAPRCRGFRGGRAEGAARLRRRCRARWPPARRHDEGAAAPGALRRASGCLLRRASPRPPPDRDRRAAARARRDTCGAAASRASRSARSRRTTLAAARALLGDIAGRRRRARPRRRRAATSAAAPCSPDLPRAGGRPGSDGERVPALSFERDPRFEQPHRDAAWRRCRSCRRSPRPRRRPRGVAPAAEVQRRDGEQVAAREAVSQVAAAHRRRQQLAPAVQAAAYCEREVWTNSRRIASDAMFLDAFAAARATSRGTRPRCRRTSRRVQLAEAGADQGARSQRSSVAMRRESRRSGAPESIARSCETPDCASTSTSSARSRSSGDALLRRGARAASSLFGQLGVAGGELRLPELEHQRQSRCGAVRRADRCAAWVERAVQQRGRLARRVALQGVGGGEPEVAGRAPVIAGAMKVPGEIAGDVGLAAR